MERYRYVILGGGMVAGYAAKVFAERGAGGQVAIVSAEATLPYERPPLSKGFLAGQEDEAGILINDAAFYRDHGIRVLLNTPVRAVDLETRRLIPVVGEPIGFEQLLIATGAQPRRLDLPGAERAEVFYLRSVDDARRIRAAYQQARRAVVLGSGFIGMEVSAVLQSQGLATTMLFPDERVWQRLFTPELSRFFEDYYRARGVTILSGSRATAFHGTERLELVQLADGRELPAELVVAGIGVAPATALFDGSALHIENGILVNEYLETNLPDVYAAGDVANYQDALFGTRRRVEHWDNAVSQGQHAARRMLGERTPFVHVPYFFSDEFDLSWEFWGDTSLADAAVQRGDPQAKSLSVWWLKERRLVAAFVLNRPEEEREFAQQAIREQREVDPAVLRDAARPLSP
ncbi:NAD(P)/FAD-dependent oxidoreductase [Kallotenue papyrolyticum]|uniref:NAD(P)/FAD-dependent oxidoreductase n=1 Tax=Kallotenue papyrolyticum TaxID=1325125 RepID=UPI0004786574|nr:FAD-dependent oxidoreductase [Kallotenue papyrolyticum]